MAHDRRRAGRSEHLGLRVSPPQRAVEASVTSLRWPRNPRLLWPLEAVTRDTESDQQRTALGEGTPLLVAQGGPHRCGAPSPAASALTGCGAAQSRAQAVVATSGWVLSGEGQTGLGCRKVPCLDLGGGCASVDVGKSRRAVRVRLVHGRGLLSSVRSVGRCLGHSRAEQAARVAATVQGGQEGAYVLLGAKSV